MNKIISALILICITGLPVCAADTTQILCNWAVSSTETVQRGESIDVIINTKVQVATEEDVPLWAAVKRYDEIVSYTQKQPMVMTSQRVEGKSYQDKITITIPSFAPDGEYEIICGVGTACEGGFYGTGIKTVGTLTVGEDKTETVQSAAFSNVNIIAEKKTLTARYTLEATNCIGNKKPYVKLWQEDVLWGVAAGDNASASETDTEFEVQLELPYGIPSGKYRVQFGFFGVNGSVEVGEIEISSNRQHGYKPLSNGEYISKTTGREHFWYVNQENALIWDGEPYIPMGAMECLSILYGYSDDVSENERRWEEDKAEIDVLAQNGVTDLYINALGNKAPAWVWEFLLDYFDDKGIRYSIQPGAINVNEMDVYYIYSNPDALVVSVSDIKNNGSITTEMNLSGIDEYGESEPIFGLCTLIDEEGAAVKTQQCTLKKSDKELKAMAYICESLNCCDIDYDKEAEKLKTAINKQLWDERNGFYYSADINLRPVNPNEKMHSGMPRHWDCVLQKCDSWSGFMALWSGVADTDKAKRVIYENMKNRDLFWAEYGIRSLAKTEPMYCIIKSGNPSCWLGPVWGIVNYMCFRGLVNYGYMNEAQDLVEKLVMLFGKDIKNHGEMHEYYHPDTGEGVNNSGFQSWNLLVNNMIAWYETGKAITEF